MKKIYTMLFNTFILIYLYNTERRNLLMRNSIHIYRVYTVNKKYIKIHPN